MCYSDEFGTDMQDFSSIKKLSKAEIINLHTSTNYTVYFIGFLPGFLYLGGLNPKLFLDRKASPTRQVEKGSVGIGGQQTGIYPDQSPGGWHIIGKTPIELFNASKSPPCTINLGDEIRFKAISKDEYNQISLRIKASNFKIKSELIYD